MPRCSLLAAVLLVLALHDESSPPTAAAGLDDQSHRHELCRGVFIHESLRSKPAVFFAVGECKNHIVSK